MKIIFDLVENTQNKHKNLNPMANSVSLELLYK